MFICTVDYSQTYLSGVCDCQFFFKFVGSIQILCLKVVKVKLNIIYKDMVL